MSEYQGDEYAMNSFEQAKADARKKYEGTGWDLRKLVNCMASLRDEKEKLERGLALVNAEYDVLRFEKVPERMEQDNVENVRYEGIGRVSITADLYCAVKDKAGLFGWLKKAKLSDLIQPSVNASTLKAFVKKRIKDGKPYPQDFLNVTPITRASITKG